MTIARDTTPGVGIMRRQPEKFHTPAETGTETSLNARSTVQLKLKEKLILSDLSRPASIDAVLAAPPIYIGKIFGTYSISFTK